MKPITRDRARAAFTQLREDLTSVASTTSQLLRATVICIVPTSRTVAVRAYHAWQNGCPSTDVRHTLNRRQQDKA